MLLICRKMNYLFVPQFLFIGIFVILFIFPQIAFSGEKVKDAEQSALITFKVTKEPLKNIIERVAKQTGYCVEVSESLLNIPVSGNFNSIQIEDLFRRILKGKNLFIIGDNEKKLLSIYTSLTENERMFIVNAGQENSFREGSNQEFLALRNAFEEKVRSGEVDLELEPGVSFKDMVASRDAFDEKIRSGEVDLELEPGVSFKDMVASRDAFDEKIRSGEVDLELEPGVSFKDMVAGRDSLDKKIRAGEVDLELDPGVSFKDMVAERDSLDKKIRNGEVELTLESPRVQKNN